MPPDEPPVPPKPKYIEINRAQLSWEAVDLENLIPADHSARAIWALVGRLDWSVFEQDIQSFEGEGGRSRWPAQLLISVWVYSYSEGVSSARAIERMTESDPGMRWLCGGQIINYHTLSDFRMQQKERLNEVFTQILGLLESEDLIDLSTVMQDGTKVRAVASKESFHRRKTVEAHLERARQAVEELNARGEGEQSGRERPTRAGAARQRAAEEKLERMKEALKELAAREAEAKPSEREGLRVSETEAEARKMKQTDGGWAPSYNVQTSTEAKNKILVAVSVNQDGNDLGQLVSAVEQVEANLGRRPERVVADNGYASRDNVREMASREIELIAPWKEAASREAGALKVNGIDREFNSSVFVAEPSGKAMRCPAGKQLVIWKQHQHHGERCRIYQAAAEDCGICAYQRRCCGEQTVRQLHRIEEGPAMQAYLERMKQPHVQELYKKRKAVAETPHLRWKTMFKWRQFSVRGLAQATKEALWLAITYNIQQWIRLSWKLSLSPS